MREESVARRYAAALFARALKGKTVVEDGADLHVVAEAIAADPQLEALLAQPLVTEEQKKLTVRNALSKKVRPDTLFFLELLIDKRRVALLPQVEAEFARMVLDYQNVARATATSAVPLTSAQIAALTTSLAARTGKTIDLQTAVDPTVIGGVLVRIGDTVLDGTVQGNLERLREQLLTQK